MKKVHIIRWTLHGIIHGVYANHEKAYRAAEEANKRRNLFYRMLGDRWVVQTFDVED